VPEYLPEIILTADVRHNLFLAVKEALNNIVKHAAASEGRIQIALKPGMLILTIQDNGKGFLKDSATASEENVSAGCQRDGLSNMRKRIESIAGRIELESLPGCGTRVKLMISIVNSMPPQEKRRAPTAQNPSS